MGVRTSLLLQSDQARASTHKNESQLLPTGQALIQVISGAMSDGSATRTFQANPSAATRYSVLPIIRRRPILRANTLPGGLICACSHSFKRRVQRSSQFPRPAAETAAINIHARIFVLLSKRSNGILLLIAKRRKREGQGRRATWDTGSDGAEDP